MEKKISKEIKIGIAFIISIFLLYFGISFLKGVNIFKPSNSYMVAFSDVTDLTPSSPVMMNGLQVGLVYSMNLDPKNPHQVIATLNMDKGVKVPKGSTFELVVPTLGGATIVFKPNHTTKDYYTSDDIIKGDRKLGLMESVSNNMLPQFSTIVPKIDSVLIGLQALVNNPSLHQSINNTEVITNQLASSTRDLSIMMASIKKDVPAITSNIATITDDVKGKTAELKSMDLKSIYESADSTLKNIQYLTQKLNSNDNSLGLLLNDRQLYDSITTTLNNASLLLKDIKENPSRYINVKVF